MKTPQKLSDTIICEKCSAKNTKEAKLCRECGNPLTQDYYKGLWLKNTLITLGLFLFPFIILFYIVNFEISTHFEQQVKNGLEYSVEVNAKLIEHFLDERKADLLSISKLDIINIDQIFIKTLLFKQFVAEKPCFDFIAVANPQGDIVFSTNNIQANIGTREYFKQSIKKNFFNSGIFYSDILGTNAMVISSPLFNQDNKIIGIILASICLRTFYELILDLRIGETSEVFLVDQQGIFLSSSRLGGKILEEKGHCGEETNPHLADGGIKTHRDYRGKKVICAYKKFEQLHGYLVSEMDKEEAIALVTKLKKIMFSIFLIFGCFLILSSFVFSRRTTSLIKKLTGTIKTAYDDVNQKKNTINTINLELRRRLADCEEMSKELRRSEELIKNITNSISSGLVAIDRMQQITYFNDVMKDYNDKEELDTNGQLKGELPFFAMPEIEHELSMLFHSAKGFQLSKIMINVKGINRSVNISGFPLLKDQQVNGATILIDDITDEVKMQAQMEDYEKLSALSQLALGAAHEINNPLQGITSYIELLLEEEKDVEKKIRTKEVLDSAYRISETVRGLLNFARPTPPMFTKISLNKLISETLSFLHHQPLFKKIVIDKTLPDSMPQITADANQIRQVLLNVFINAAQAMPQGGSLHISTKKVKFEENIETEITDTGVGILRDNLKKVFDPFFTTKKSEGTGLGLSISYSYIKNHNGNININSELGKGTQVVILLPIRQAGHVQSEVIE